MEYEGEPEQEVEGSKSELYSILNLPKDASLEDVRSAYKKFSLAYHPDRIQSEAGEQDADLIKEAQHRFEKVKKAYDVLSDATKRKIYDHFGEQGLQNEHQLVPYINDFEKAMAKQKEEAKVEADLKVYKPLNMVEAHFSSLGVAYVTGNAPYLEMFRITQKVSGKWGKRTEFRIGGQGMFQTIPNMGQQAQGHVELGVKYDPYQDLNFGLTTKLGVNTAITSEVTKKLFGTTELGAKYTSNLQEMQSYALELTHRFNSFIEANASVTFHSLDAPGILRKLSEMPAEALPQEPELKAPGDEFSVGVNLALTEMSRTNLALSLQDEHMGLEAVHQVQLAETIMAIIAGDVSLTGNFSIATTIYQAMTQRTQVGLGFRGGNQGVMVIIALERGGQRYQFPIPISDRASLASVTSMIVIPTLISSVVNFLILAPAQNRKMRRHKEKQRAQFYEATIRARKEALTEQRLMETPVRKKKQREQGRNGIVIVRAEYGNLEEEITTPDPECPPYFDVTGPLQYLVEDSQLHLQASPKHELLGFYDPCPNEPKWLQVAYLFKGQQHEVVIADDEELHLPSLAHKVEA